MTTIKEKHVRLTLLLLSDQLFVAFKINFNWEGVIFKEMMDISCTLDQITLTRVPFKLRVAQNNVYSPFNITLTIFLKCEFSTQQVLFFLSAWKHRIYLRLVSIFSRSSCSMVIRLLTFGRYINDILPKRKNNFKEIYFEALPLRKCSKSWGFWIQIFKLQFTLYNVVQLENCW